MPLHETLRSLRVAAGLTQTELGDRLGKNQFWVSNRETGKTRSWLLEDIQEWAEACGFQFDAAFVRQGSTINRIEHAPDAVEAAQELLEAWSAMTPRERVLIRNMIRVALDDAG